MNCVSRAFGSKQRLLLLAVLTAAVVMAGCGAPPDEIGVVAGSTHIGVILEDLAEDWVAIHSLFPPATCPSQFDMKPSHIAALRNSQAILLHPWQEEMANVREGLSTAGAPEERVHILRIEDNWMIPEVQQAATARVSAVLGELKNNNPQEGIPDLSGRLAERERVIEQQGAEAEDRLQTAGAAGAPILCNVMQADFLEWAGFEVVGTYGPPEDLSVAAIERLLAKGKEAGVTLVVDNLQSGDPRVGGRIAGELGAGHAVLSNFPRAVPDTDTWEATLDYNITALVDALENVTP